MSNFSIIIPFYCTKQKHITMTLNCLDSLREYTDLEEEDEIILVDDASPLSPGELPEIVNRPVNGGYAAAVNSGLEFASNDILIISNNDIIFTPDWLEAIMKPINEGWDISSIRTSDNGWTTEQKITEGDKFGSLWAMRREVYDTIGGLDETFGNYFEDLDYQKRAEKAGFRVGKNHNHLVEHLGKATFKDIDPEDRQYFEAMKKYKERYGVVD